MPGAVRTFLTHDRGKPLTYGVIADRRGDAGDPEGAIRDLGEAALRHPGACAFGKVTVIAETGIHSFQVTQAGDAAPCFCGNSTAAAVAWLGGARVRMQVHGPAAAPYEVTACVEDRIVSQLWTVPNAAVEERNWHGRQVVIAAPLNPYAIVLGSLPEGYTAEEARRELLGPGCAGKLAVIARASGVPLVEFHNSNGKHGAAPHTGMATIAIAARHCAWLAECFADGLIDYPTAAGPRRTHLPLLAETGCGGVAVAMAPVTVSLERPAMELVA